LDFKNRNLVENPYFAKGLNGAGYHGLHNLIYIISRHIVQRWLNFTKTLAIIW